MRLFLISVGLSVTPELMNFINLAHGAFAMLCVCVCVCVCVVMLSLAAILVEQHAHQILPVIREAIVLERGRVVHRGAGGALSAGPAVLDRRLGVAAH